MTRKPLIGARNPSPLAFNTPPHPSLPLALSPTRHSHWNMIMQRSPCIQRKSNVTNCHTQFSFTFTGGRFQERALLGFLVPGALGTRGQETFWKNARAPDKTEHLATALKFFSGTKHFLNKTLSYCCTRISFWRNESLILQYCVIIQKHFIKLMGTAGCSFNWWVVQYFIPCMVGTYGNWRLPKLGHVNMLFHQLA